MSTRPSPLAAASASAALGKAGDFTKSVEGKKLGMYAVPTNPVTPKKAAGPEMNRGVGGEVADVASGLAWKKAQVDAVAPKKFAEGGKIKKDGVQVVDAEKGETVLPTKNKKRVMELAMKHLDGMKDGMEASKKKKAAKKEEPKSEVKKHKKVHPFKRTTITHHQNGSHTMIHEHDTDAAQDAGGGHENDESMMNALQGAMSGPQTLAGAAAAPAAAAPAAPAAAAPAAPSTPA